MVEIKALAASSNLVIVTTIHQPSTKVYNGFDQILLLSGGREAYCGLASEAPAYFEHLGWPMECNTNPAEFFLDLVNSDFVAQRDVDKILDAWHSAKSTHSSKDSYDCKILLANHAKKKSKTCGSGSLRNEVAVMFSRHATLISRDSVLYIGRSFIFLLSNLYFSFVYWEARKRQQDQVFNRMWLCSKWLSYSLWLSFNE
jgi:hypothetical protein